MSFDQLDNSINKTNSLNQTVFGEEVDRNYWALLLVIVPCVTIFGNVLVILSVYRERTLQTCTNYFIVSLALADLLVAIGAMPFAVYALVSYLCRFEYMGVGLFVISSLFVFCFNFDRI